VTSRLRTGLSSTVGSEKGTFTRPRGTNVPLTRVKWGILRALASPKERGTESKAPGAPGGKKRRRALIDEKAVTMRICRYTSAEKKKTQEPPSLVARTWKKKGRGPHHRTLIGCETAPGSDEVPDGEQREKKRMECLRTSVSSLIMRRKKRKKNAAYRRRSA